MESRMSKGLVYALIGVGSLLGATCPAGTQESVGAENAAPALGQAPADIFRPAPLPPDAPKPSPDSRNLEGTWYHADPLELYVTKTMYGKPLPFTAEGKRIYDRRQASKNAGKPIANAGSTCRPTGQPWQLDLNMPFVVLKSKNTLNFIFEEFHGVWVIRMNQPPRPDGPREYMGDSVGHWESDTLVIDTINYKEAFWIDSNGVPVSRDGHLVHRIRKVQNHGVWALEIIRIIDDPTMYTEQWSSARLYLWRPDKAVFAEYNCEYQTGAPDALSVYGMVAE
jgi:hypothetical protein